MKQEEVGEMGFLIAKTNLATYEERIPSLPTRKHKAESNRVGSPPTRNSNTFLQTFGLEPSLFENHIISLELILGKLFLSKKFMLLGHDLVLNGEFESSGFRVNPTLFQRV